MRYSTMKVLYVDYDEGAIGQSVTIAYNQMKGPGLPTLLQRSPAEYPTEQEVQEDVCKGEYWGAIIPAQMHPLLYNIHTHLDFRQLNQTAHSLFVSLSTDTFFEKD